MKWTHTPLRTLREDPQFTSIKSHTLMVRADFIQPLASGLFTYGPFMVRSLQKLEAIIREEPFPSRLYRDLYAYGSA